MELASSLNNNLGICFSMYLLIWLVLAILLIHCILLDLSLSLVLTISSILCFVCCCYYVELRITSLNIVGRSTKAIDRLKLARIESTLVLSVLGGLDSALGEGQKPNQGVGFHPYPLLRDEARIKTLGGRQFHKNTIWWAKYVKTNH